MSETPKTEWRKAVFVGILTAYSLVVATVMGFDPELNTKVAEIVADGLISLALFVVVSWLAADTADQSGVLRSLGTRMSGGKLAMLQKAEPPTTSQYTTVDPNDYVDPPGAKG